MPQFGPIKRSDLVQYLRQAGFDGPYGGGKHSYMVRGQLKLAIPNPHHGEAIRTRSCHPSVAPSRN